MAPGTLVRLRPYQVLEAHRLAIEEEVSQMLQECIIELSNSPWCSLVFVVPKPDGSLCLCNEFRKLNSISDFDSYPLHRVDELIECLGGASFISTLDITKTVFSTSIGSFHWQYQVLLFVLHGAPATFQRLMDNVLCPHRHFTASYMDDVIIHCSDWADHLFYLLEVPSKLHWSSCLPKKIFYMGLS